jgi:ZIP family zinc transporter
MELLQITGYGLLTGVAGTGLGGILGLFCRRRSAAFLSAVLSYAAGAMLAVTTFGLLPQALKTGGLPLVLVGVLIGVVGMTAGESWMEKRQEMSSGGEMRRLGLAIAVGIALHNLPEGLAIGSGMQAIPALGFSLMLTILLHDIPEGLSMVIPLEKGNLSGGKAVAISALSGVPTGIGAYLGGAAGAVSPAVLTFCLSLAAGAMLYVAASDLLPQTQALYPGRVPGGFLILGLMTGMIISICIE